MKMNEIHWQWWCICMDRGEESEDKINQVYA